MDRIGLTTLSILLLLLTRRRENSTNSLCFTHLVTSGLILIEISRCLFTLSRFIRPGAVVISHSMVSDSQIMGVAVKNIDKTIAIVLLNQSEDDVQIEIRYCIYNINQNPTCKL